MKPVTAPRVETALVIVVVPLIKPVAVIQFSVENFLEQSMQEDRSVIPIHSEPNRVHVLSADPQADQRLIRQAAQAIDLPSRQVWSVIDTPTAPEKVEGVNKALRVVMEQN